MLLTNEKNTRFGDNILDLFDGAKSVHIASGYIGLDAFRRAEPRLRRVVDAGGDVRIILGLGLFEGLSEKMVEALRDFDKYCRGKQTESGVKACAYQRFHGKLYLIKNSNGQRIASVGSSNFSSTGFGDWWEGNLLVQDQSQVDEVDNYLQRLEESNAIDLAAVSIPIKGHKKGGAKKKSSFVRSLPPKYSGTIPAKLGKPAFKIPVRTTEKAHLNLFMGAGRKSEKMHPYDAHLPKSERREIEVFKRRDWYEVEIGINKGEAPNELLTLLPAQTDPWEFTLVTQDGDAHNAKFKRKANDKKDSRSLREVGLDFMTNPRTDLGRVLKGRLEQMGFLHYGEPVTEEILEEANLTEMRFHKLKDGVFLLDL